MEWADWRKLSVYYQMHSSIVWVHSQFYFNKFNWWYSWLSCYVAAAQQVDKMIEMCIPRICLGAVLFFSYLISPIECFVSTSRTSVINTYSKSYNDDIRRGSSLLPISMSISTPSSVPISPISMATTSILSSNTEVLSAILAVSAIGITLEQTTFGKALSVSYWVCFFFHILCWYHSSNQMSKNNHTGSTCDDVDIISIGKHWPFTIQVASIYIDQ